jgi:hypothetical protein
MLEANLSGISVCPKGLGSLCGCWTSSSFSESPFFFFSFFHLRKKLNFVKINVLQWVALNEIKDNVINQLRHF